MQSFIGMTAVPAEGTLTGGMRGGTESESSGPSEIADKERLVVNGGTRSLTNG
jgi:hypothetical protein